MKKRNKKAVMSTKETSFCAVVGVITNDKQTEKVVVGDNTNNGLNSTQMLAVLSPLSFGEGLGVRPSPKLSN